MKLSLAPIQGMTNAYYRNLYKAFFGGIDTYYAPFVSTTVKEHSSPVLYKDLEQAINETPLIPQILGNKGDDFNFYASVVKSMGYDEINWNIGCPFPKVAKKKKGSGILAHPDMVTDFMDKVCGIKDYDLTVKMRLGYNTVEEGKEVIRRLNKYPVKSVIIHARTGLQKYEGLANLDDFESLYKLSDHPVIYNGDIFTLDDFNRIQDRFPNIEEFMLGRGALRDPFLPADIKGQNMTGQEKMAKLKEFHNYVFDHYQEKLSGDKHLCDRMKEFWSYLYYHMDSNGKYMKNIRKSRTASAYQTAVYQLFNDHPIFENKGK